MKTRAFSEILDNIYKNPSYKISSMAVDSVYTHRDPYAPLFKINSLKDYIDVRCRKISLLLFELYYGSNYNDKDLKRSIFTDFYLPICKGLLMCGFTSSALSTWNEIQGSITVSWIDSMRSAGLNLKPETLREYKQNLRLAQYIWELFTSQLDYYLATYRFKKSKPNIEDFYKILENIKVSL